jgi:hypothetical protein
VFETYLRELRAVVDGTADLSTVDAERVGLVLGTAIRAQLEAGHPDGLDGDDIRQVIAACQGAGIDPDVLLIVLAGALGIHPEEADQIPRPSPEEVTTHAVRLLTCLVPPHRTDKALAAALRQIEQAERMELP